MRLLIRFAAALTVLLPAALGAAPQEPPSAEKPPPSPLAFEAVSVEPERPAADTLCRLAVRLRNGGSGPATSLRFSVEVAGHPLTVYGNQLFLEALPPGATTEVRLYNFWTTESGRPAPADGKLRVKVTLEEASWVTIETDEEGTEVWTLGAPVPGLPVASEVTLEMAGK